MGASDYARYCELCDKQDAEEALTLLELRELEGLKKKDPRCKREAELLSEIGEFSVPSGDDRQSFIASTLARVEQEDRVIPLRPEFDPRKQNARVGSHGSRTRRRGSRRLIALALAAAAPAAALYLLLMPSSTTKHDSSSAVRLTQNDASARASASSDNDSAQKAEGLRDSPQPHEETLQPARNESLKIEKVDLSVKKQAKFRSPKKSSPIAKASLKDLLSEARSAIGRGDWNSAAQAYRRLRNSYPNSPESRTVLLTLAQLELDRLGQPTAALRSFDRYLQSGGALSHEARYGRIRALRAQGNKSAERAALKEFLRHHKSSANAPLVRRRLSELTE